MIFFTCLYLYLLIIYIITCQEFNIFFFLFPVEITTFDPCDLIISGTRNPMPASIAECPAILLPFSHTQMGKWTAFVGELSSQVAVTSFTTASSSRSLLSPRFTEVHLNLCVPRHPSTACTLQAQTGSNGHHRCPSTCSLLFLPSGPGVFRSSKLHHGHCCIRRHHAVHH